MDMHEEDNGGDHETVIDTTPPAEESVQAEDRGDVVVASDVVDEPAAAEVAKDPKPAAKADDKPDDKAEARIPKARFDEVNQRMKDAEALALSRGEELAKLKNAAPATPAAAVDPKALAVDLDAKEEEYIAALQAGDAKKAAAVRREINTEIRNQATQAAKTDITAELTQRDLNTSLNKVVAESLEKYPFLNDASEDKNEQAITEVVEWRDFYVSKGHALPTALQMAVAKIAPMHAEAPDDKDDKDGGAEEGDDKDKGNVRQIEARRRNAAASNAQPPQLNGVGERASAGGRQDVSKMTDDEFDKLPAAEKKRLRGD